MTTFDRNRWKGASLEKNKEFGKKIDALTKYESENKRPDYHEIKEGTNVFRICPPHDPEDPSMQAKVITWLPQRVEEKDKDGNGTGKFEIKSRPIFNSRIHGDTPKDIIEEYINFVYKQVYDETQDKDERSKRLSPITGYKDKNSKWIPGIRFSTSFVMYAFKEGKIGRLELYKSDKDRMEELNISEDSDEPITTDCFSDPNEGVSLIITRQKKEKGGFENILSKRSFSKKFKSYEEFIESEMLTDEQLKELSEQQSLKEIFQNAYKRSDFTKALEGLQIFDEKNKFNVFENDDFLAVVEEIDSYYPENDEESTKSNKSEKTVDLRDMTRDELKAYIEENDLDIVVKKSMSEDDIRDLIQEAEYDPGDSEIEKVEEADDTDSAVEETKSEETKEDPKDKKDLPWEKASTVSSSDTAKKIAEMKAKYAKK